MARVVFLCPARAAALAASVCLIPTPVGAMAQDGPDPRIEETTGRHLANWPPARRFDHLHMRLEIDIPDMDRARLTARETLTMTPLGLARDRIHLDAVGMAITGVAVDGLARPFEHDGRDLEVPLPHPVRPGRVIELVIDYTLDYAVATGNGLNWSPGDPEADTETDRAAQIHTQGEPEFASAWYPCHDFPNERLTTEILVTVDDGYMVCSNGRLVDKRRGSDGRSTWHWLQDGPHANYLVSLVIGVFDVVGVGGAETARPGLPLLVYTPTGTGEAVAELFAKTPDMVAFFEEKFDEPYPWDKYAQVIVRNFHWGGMENTSASTLHEGASRGGPGSQDELIAHELAHQWLGDLVTCKSWEHAWLNEGWASLCEALWAEHEGGRAAYRRIISRFLATERAMNHTVAPADPSIVSNRYADPDEPFTRPDNAYSKGALILHMLRSRLGDETFTRGLRLYIDRFKFKEVETDDLRLVMEEVSGQSLERFFDQWTGRPGLPRLSIDLDWDSAAGELRVRVEQTQTIDAANPAYAFTLPIYVKFGDGEGQYVYVETETRLAEAAFDLPAEPVDYDVDPNMTVIARHTVRRPEAVGASSPPE